MGSAVRKKTHFEFAPKLSYACSIKNVCLIEEGPGPVNPDSSVSELFVSLVPLHLIFEETRDFRMQWLMIRKNLESKIENKMKLKLEKLHNKKLPVD